MRAESKKHWRSRKTQHGKGNPKKEKKKDCFECEECLYIGEGDFACMKDIPVIVMEEYFPTEEFNYCSRQ